MPCHSMGSGWEPPREASLNEAGQHITFCGGQALPRRREGDDGVQACSSLPLTRGVAAQLKHGQGPWPLAVLGQPRHVHCLHCWKGRCLGQSAARLGSIAAVVQRSTQTGSSWPAAWSPAWSCLAQVWPLYVAQEAQGACLTNLGPAHCSHATTTLLSCMNMPLHCRPRLNMTTVPV